MFGDNCLAYHGHRLGEIVVRLAYAARRGPASDTEGLSRVGDGLPLQRPISSGQRTDYCCNATKRSTRADWGEPVRGAANLGWAVIRYACDDHANVSAAGPALTALALSELPLHRRCQEAVPTRTFLLNLVPGQPCSIREFAMHDRRC